MATGVPEMLDAGKVDLMLACLKARTADAAREALLKLGIVQDDHRISYTAIKDTWGSICAVTHRGSVVECTCWHHRRRGHCPHMWAVTALTGMRHFEKEVLPEFPRADMQSGSSQEGRPAKKEERKAGNCTDQSLRCLLLLMPCLSLRQSGLSVCSSRREPNVRFSIGRFDV